MNCSFCGRELDRCIQECPYCHCRVEHDAQILMPEERDTFAGVTIEEDGTAFDGVRVEEAGEERGSYAGSAGPQIRVQTFGCGSGILMTLLILGGILAMVFFFLPAFLIFAAIAAVAVFIMRLFM